MAMVAFPALSFCQTSISTVKVINPFAIEKFNSPENLSTQIVWGTYSKNDVTNLSYKKSIDLVSIKAFRKSLQIRVKETRIS